MKLARSTLVNGLIAALALGTTVLVVMTDDEPTTTDLEARANNLIPSFPREELVSISARAGTGSWTLTIAAAPDGGRNEYRLRAPDPLEADSDAVDALIRTLELAGAVRRLEAAEADRAVLGLTKPRAVLEVVFEHARYEIRVGNEALTPADTTYVEVATQNGSTVHLVRTDLTQELLLPTDALRPRSALPVTLGEALEFEWSQGDSKVSLERKGPSFFDENKQRVRRDSLERLGLELERVKIEQFLESSVAERALAPDASALRVKLTTKDRSLAFRAGGSCPNQPHLEVLIRTAPSEAAGCVAKGLRQLFVETTGALLDNTPFALRTDEVEALHLVRGSEVLELTRAESGFRLKAQGNLEVALEAGNTRLDALTRTTAERVTQPSSALGLDKPAGRLRLSSTVIDGVPRFEESVDIGAPRADGRLPVRRSTDGVTLLVPADAAWAYAADSTLLKPRRLLEFGPSELSSLTIRATGTEQKLVRAGDAFQLVEPQGHQHDPSLVLDLVQALGTLNADRWVSDVSEPKHGLGDPQAVLLLELGGKAPKRIELRLGARTSGGVFASIDTIPGTFVLPRTFANQATTLLLSRSAFTTDPAELSLIVLESSGRSVTLERRGEGFSASDSALAPAAVERLVQAVANLRPEYAVHTGKPRANEGFDKPSLLVRMTEASGRQRVVRVGATDTHRGIAVYFVRTDGVDATYVIDERLVRGVLEELAE